MYLASRVMETPSDVARPKRIARIMGDQDVHGWITAALIRGMAGLEGQATFEHVDGTLVSRGASVKEVETNQSCGLKLPCRPWKMSSRSGREKKEAAPH